MAPTEVGGWIADQYRDSGNLASRQRLHQTASTASVPWHRFVFHHLLKAPEDSRVLEVGCGPATLWVENAGHIPASWHITLTDQSSGMVDAAVATVKDLRPSILVHAAEVTALPFSENRFQMVVANHMLYHVTERARALAEIARVLVPGGLLVAATNGPGHMIELKQLVPMSSKGRGFLGASSPFDLENGPAQMQPWFAAVRVSRHHNRLLVRDPQLVVDYLQSVSAEPMSEGAKARIRARISREIAERGCFAIHPEAGVILARRRSKLPA